MSDRGTTIALILAVIALALLALVFVAERMWPL